MVGCFVDINHVGLALNHSLPGEQQTFNQLAALIDTPRTLSGVGFFATVARRQEVEARRHITMQTITREDLLVHSQSGANM